MDGSIKVANLGEGLHYDLSGRPWAYVTITEQHGRIVRYIGQDVCLGLTELEREFKVTPRQARTVQLLFGRRTNNEIAAALNVTPHTARRHVEAVLFKLNAKSRYDIERILVETLIRNAESATKGTPVQ